MKVGENQVAFVRRGGTLTRRRAKVPLSRFERSGHSARFLQKRAKLATESLGRCRKVDALGLIPLRLSPFSTLGLDTSHTTV